MQASDLQQASSCSVEQVRGLKIRAGLSDGQRGHANAPGIHKCAGESRQCVLSLGNFNPYQPKRRKGTWLWMLMFYGSPGSVKCGCC